MNRSIRVALGVLVAIVGLTLFLVVAFDAIQKRFVSFSDAWRRLMASGSQVQAASRISIMPRASVSRSI